MVDETLEAEGEELVHNIMEHVLADFHSWGSQLLARFSHPRSAAGDCRGGHDRGARSLQAHGVSLPVPLVSIAL
jgi:hypothetical protein